MESPNATAWLLALGAFGSHQNNADCVPGYRAATRLRVERLIRTFDLNVCSYIGASGVNRLWRHSVVSPHAASRSAVRLTGARLSAALPARSPSWCSSLVAAVLVLRGPSVNQGFTVDESRWIATSRYFWITFVDRDLFGPAWQPNYIVYTHPPVARYLIGFGLWLQGWQPGSAQRPLRQPSESGLQRAGRQRPRPRPALGGAPGHVRLRRRVGRPDLPRRPDARRTAGGPGGGGVRARQPAADDRLDARPGRVDRGGVRAAGSGPGVCA